MDLSQLLSGIIKQRWLATAALSMTLSACAASPVQPMSQATANSQQAEANASPAADSKVSEKPAPSVDDLPLTPEMIYYIMTAEIAAQRGELGIAVDSYNEASKLADSAKLASRSAQIATYSRDKARIKRALDRWVEVAPDDADVYIVRAPFEMVEGRYDDVVHSVDKALALAPEKTAAYLARISQSLTELAKPDDALNTVKRLKAFQQNNSEARYTYARLASYYRRYELAAPIVDDLLSQSPQREELLVLKADILQRTGHPDKAMSLIARAANKDSASEELRYTYAKLLGENGKTEQAKKIFEKLHADNPKNEEVVFALGLIALDQKNSADARRYFAQTIKLGDHVQQAAFFMGLTEQMAGDEDSALVWFASVPASSPRYDSAQRNYLNILADRGQIQQARRHIQQLRMKNPDQAIQYYAFEADFLRQRGLNQEAFDLYGQALKENPANTELLYGRAMVAESLDDLASLERDLNLILKIDPNNAAAMNALGYTLTDRTDRHQEALALIEKALEIKPGDPYYLDSLGWVYYRLGQLDKAEKFLKQAVNIQPDPEFLAHLGEVLWAQDKKREAKKIWQKGLDKDAKNALILSTMQRLNP
jgi:tetratricopeptide (TPR) repeat protein